MTKTPLHIVHTESSLGWGGQEIRILTEAMGMRQRGYAVTLIAPPTARIFHAAEERNIPVVALPIGRKNLKGLLALRRWLITPPCDVINTHSSTDSWLSALATRTMRHAPPLVRTRHISAPIPNNAATRWLYQSATAYIATTGERLRQQLIKHNGFDPARITSVPTGIDTDHFVPGNRTSSRSQLNLPLNTPIVGIVATLRSWKGHVYLLEAFARLADPDTLLLIVGDGPQRQNLEQEITRLNLTGRVLMPGNQHDVTPWLRAMDVFVLPSYANEGVPQALMQAMACGLPVISTPIGSITEAVQDGISGRIVPARDAGQLHQAIQSFLQDPEQRDTFGAAARNTAVEKFGLDAMLDKMEIIFNQAAHPG